MPATRLADAPSVLQAAVHSDTPDTAAEWWTPRFPDPSGLDLAARMFTARPRWAGEEGPRPRIVLSAGSLRITAPDLARRERTAERALKRERSSADLYAAHLVSQDHTAPIDERCPKCPTDPDPSREITGWSRKSRANMVAALCELDYRPLLGDRSRVPGMVTLTYPGDWLTVAPNGRAAKRHLQLLRKRYVKAWGHDLRCVWKLEFQMRGAPHFHLLTVPPHGKARTPGKRARASAWVGAGLTFWHWLSLVWADIVAHPDPEEYANHVKAGTGVDFEKGLRSTDPKRVAVYFSKHGSFSAKEYQNCVPPEWQEPGQGPGRFWGYWGLRRVTVGVEVTFEQATAAARIVRRWASAQGTTREAVVTRTKGGRILSEVAEVQGLAGVEAIACRTSRRRKVRRRVVRLKNGRGFVSVNNGEEFGVAVAGALDVLAEEVYPPGSPRVRLERLTPEERQAMRERFAEIRRKSQ